MCIRDRDADNAKYINTLINSNVKELTNLQIGQANVILQVLDKKAMKDKYKVCLLYTSKLAIFDKGELVEVFRGSNHSLDCLPLLCYRYPLKRGIIASVITLSNTIRRPLGRLPFNIIELSHETPVPITNLYKTPQTLGMDLSLIHIYWSE